MEEMLYEFIEINRTFDVISSKYDYYIKNAWEII